MLVLTEEIGQPVIDAEGHALGRLRELTVDARDERASVARIGVQRSRGELRWFPWDDVVSFERSGVLLGPGATASPVDPSMGHPPPNELWLHRDVLDAQILDAGGARIERVGDLVLMRLDHELRVVAVQFGAAPVLRRLGFRRLASHFAAVSVEWHELHLVSGRGLAAQLAAAPEHLDLLTHAQLASLIAQLSTDRASTVLGAVGADRAAVALRLAHPDVSSRVVHALPEPFDSEVLAAMPADDAVATLRRVSPSRRLELLDRLAPGRADELRELLAAEPGTARGLMTTEYRTAPAGTTGEMLRRLLISPPASAAGLSTLFVLDPDGRPIGAVDALALLTDPDPEPRPLPVLRADTPLDAVIRLFATHDLRNAPVVDDTGRMIGAVAIDDVLDELVAERLPGRSRYLHLLSRHRRTTGNGSTTDHATDHATGPAGGGHRRQGGRR